MSWIEYRRRSTRATGLFLGVSSLPGSGQKCNPIGDFGTSAREWIDILRDMEQSVWQILPLGPPLISQTLIAHRVLHISGRSDVVRASLHLNDHDLPYQWYSASPYSSSSVFAINPILISLEDLAVSWGRDLEDVIIAPPSPPSSAEMGVSSSHSTTTTVLERKRLRPHLPGPRISQRANYPKISRCRFPEAARDKFEDLAKVFRSLRAQKLKNLTGAHLADLLENRLSVNEILQRIGYAAAKSSSGSATLSRMTRIKSLINVNRAQDFTYRHLHHFHLRELLIFFADHSPYWLLNYLFFEAIMDWLVAQRLSTHADLLDPHNEHGTWPYDWEQFPDNWNLWPKKFVGLSYDDLIALLRESDKMNIIIKINKEIVNVNMFDLFAFHLLCQFASFGQLITLAAYADHHHVRILSDAACFIPYQSADVWGNPHLFMLDQKTNEQIYYSGVPPDAFSETGQLWGHPLYDWDHSLGGLIDWWRDRFTHVLRYSSMIRIDHFRGFSGCWAVSAGWAKQQKTALKGQWLRVPGEKLFDALFAEDIAEEARRRSVGGGDRVLRKRDSLSNPSDLLAKAKKSSEGFLRRDDFFAEDLGLITNDVRRLSRRYGFPSMKVAQFGFGRLFRRVELEAAGVTEEDVVGGKIGEREIRKRVQSKLKGFDLESIYELLDFKSEHIPANYETHMVGYLGTHDNPTFRQWWINEADSIEKYHIIRFLGPEICSDANVHWLAIRALLFSGARLSVCMTQDILGLGGDARLNNPGTFSPEHWTWKLDGSLFEIFTPQIRQRLREYTRLSGRSSRDATIASLSPIDPAALHNADLEPRLKKRRRSWSEQTLDNTKRWRQQTSI